MCALPLSSASCYESGARLTWEETCPAPSQTPKLTQELQVFLALARGGPQADLPRRGLLQFFLISRRWDGIACLPELPVPERLLPASREDDDSIWENLQTSMFA